MRYLLIILSLTFLNAQLSPDDLNWTMEQYTDEFGDAMNGSLYSYITNAMPISGKYNNSLSTNNDLKVKLNVTSDEGFSFSLYHQGNYNLPLREGNGKIQHIVKVKHNNKVITFEDIPHYDDSFRISTDFREEYEKNAYNDNNGYPFGDDGYKLLQMFYEGGDIKFIVESFKCFGTSCYNKSSWLSNYSKIGDYSFTINADGFKKIHQEKYPNYNIEEEETLWVSRKEKFESDLKKEPKKQKSNTSDSNQTYIIIGLVSVLLAVLFK
tara:strand:- start:213 stop:1013 length:801 start_codon:yes stop_codon:yes gene_type:complete